MTETAFNPFQVAQEQLQRVVDLLALDPVSADLLAEPMRELAVRIGVRLDDGGMRLFRGFRVVHNDARGPALGGVRFHPAASLDLVRARAMWMTWRAALVDVPLGGSAGGVACDPHELSLGEQERLCRGWVRALARDLGSEVDIAEPDLGSNAQHILWMVDEHDATDRTRRPGFATGKPVGLGGSHGRREATGYGMAVVLREALREIGLRPENARVSIQGYGAVGRHMCELFRQLGGAVTCVAAWSPSERQALACVSPAGLDPDLLTTVFDVAGDIDRSRAEAADLEVIPGEGWLAQDVDVLVSAAVENQITADTVGAVRPCVRVVVEGADGAVVPRAEAILRERGVLVVPSFLATAGGVVGSHFEQVQSAMNYAWERDEVLGKLDRRISAAYQAASSAAARRNVPLRDAALAIAVSRVAEACRARGWS